MAKKQREELKKTLNEPIENHVRLLIDAEYRKGCKIQADIDKALTDDMIEECVYNIVEALINFMSVNTGRPIKDIMSLLIKQMVPLNVSKVKEGGKVNGKLVS